MHILLRNKPKRSLRRPDNRVVGVAEEETVGKGEEESRAERGGSGREETREEGGGQVGVKEGVGAFCGWVEGQ